MCYIEKKNKVRVPLWADLLIFLVLLFIASLIGVESTLPLIGSTDFESVKYSFLSAILSSIMVFLVIWLQHCIMDVYSVCDWFFDLFIKWQCLYCISTLGFERLVFESIDVYFWCFL